VQRALVVQGLDPIEERKRVRDERQRGALKLRSFRQYALAYIEAHGSKWENKVGRGKRALCEPVWCTARFSLRIWSKRFCRVASLRS
jgi:hypothetical protein